MGIHGLWEVSNLLRTVPFVLSQCRDWFFFLLFDNSFFQIMPNLRTHFPQLQSIQSQPMAPTICRSLRDFVSVSMQGMCILYFCPQSYLLICFFLFILFCALSLLYFSASGWTSATRCSQELMCMPVGTPLFVLYSTGLASLQLFLLFLSSYSMVLSDLHEKEEELLLCVIIRLEMEWSSSYKPLDLHVTMWVIQVPCIQDSHWPFSGTWWSGGRVGTDE